MYDQFCSSHCCCCFKYTIRLWDCGWYTLAVLETSGVSVGSRRQSVSMSSSRLRLRRASFSLNLPKHDLYKSTIRSRGPYDISSLGSNLTPDIQAPTSKPLLLDPAAVDANFVRVGNYLIYGAANDSASSQASSSNHDAVNIITEERVTCRVK